MKYYSPYFAQAYGEGDYGEGTYSCTAEQRDNGTCTVAAGSSGGSGSSGGGALADTGVAMVAIVTLACLLIFISLVIRIWRRKPALQEVVVDEEPQITPTERQD